MSGHGRPEISATDAEPAGTEPADARPTGTEPADARQTDTEPAGTGQPRLSTRGRAGADDGGAGTTDPTDPVATVQPAVEPPGDGTILAGGGVRTAPDDAGRSPADSGPAGGKAPTEKTTGAEAVTDTAVTDTAVTGTATTDTAVTGTATTDTAIEDTATTDKAPVGATTTDKAPVGATTTDKAAVGGAAREGAEAATAPPVEENPPADPWAAFAPAPERAPGRARRVGNAVGRVLAHEYTLVCLGGLLLAVLMTWPTLRYPWHTIPQDIGDPTLQAWQMAWSGHILLTDPGHFWHANMFFPERYSLAFTDSSPGYAPAGMVGEGPAAALLRYNIVFVLAHALAFIGSYALVRQLGAGRTGAAVAAVAFAYAPWRLAHGGHLNVISTGGIALALAMLARGHGWSLRHGFRPERRHAGWAVAGWLVAAWQLSLGFAIGLPFAYVLFVVVVVAVVAFVERRVRLGAAKRPFGRRLFAIDLVGAAVFATVGLLMALPYLKVVELHPYARRTVADVHLYSPPASGFFVAPAQSRIWGAAHAGARDALSVPGEMTLLPGFVLYALALAGLVFSIWTLRQRLLLLAGVLGTAVLAMGTRFLGGRFTYLPLFDHLPGWNALRTPGRLVLYTTLLLAILAAGAVGEFVRRAETLSAERVPPRPGFWLRLATLVPLALVVVEGLNVTPHPVVPRQPVALRTVDGPMLVLPSGVLPEHQVMLWSTTRFQPVVNGVGGFSPRLLDEVRMRTVAFPDAASVEYLRGLGVRTVVLLRAWAVGTSWEATLDLPVDALGIRREDVGDAVVFYL